VGCFISGGDNKKGIVFIRDYSFTEGRRLRII